MIEGREPRGEFEAMVDGLAEDFQPVGTYEKLLVQEIAACFWRKRRLLRFESRAAFESRDRRTFDAMHHSVDRLDPRYRIENENFDAEDILAKAGLGLDIPNERDSLRVVRYEGSISRNLRQTLAQLKTQQSARRARPDAGTSAFPAESDSVIDTNSMAINAGPEHRHLGAKTSRFSHALDQRRWDEEDAADAELEAADEAAAAAAAAQNAQNNQTKPNPPANPGIQPSPEDCPEGAESSSQADRASAASIPLALK
jgi:hypothetical protein